MNSQNNEEKDYIDPRETAAIKAGWEWHTSKDRGGKAHPEYWERDGIECYADLPPEDKSTVYLFFRDSGFYPVELANDFAAIEDAKLNPGTMKVENAITGALIWPISP